MTYNMSVDPLTQARYNALNTLTAQIPMPLFGNYTPDGFIEHALTLT